MRAENELKLMGFSKFMANKIQADMKAQAEANFRNLIEHKVYQLEFEISCLKERVSELEQKLSNE